MIDLDDPAAIRGADPGDMLGAVVALATRCREGYALGRALAPAPSGDGVRAVAFCGMGGSGVAGDVLAALAAPRLASPVVVVRSPELPEFVGPHTLAIVSSYSGDTAETLTLFDEALARGARVIALTSGGELERRADAAGLPAVVVPAGLMPRAAFGLLALATLGSLVAVGLMPDADDDVDEATAELTGVLSSVGPDAVAHANPGKDLARRLVGRVPVVWGAEGIGAVAAARWKTQLNENAKIPAFASSLPELDHNEVVGWSPAQGERFAVIALRHDGEHPDVAARFALSLEIAASSGALVEEVRARGRSPLTRLLTLVQIGDLVSVYLALAREVDPSPVEAIARLKAALAGA